MAEEKDQEQKPDDADEIDIEALLADDDSDLGDADLGPADTAEASAESGGGEEEAASEAVAAAAGGGGKKKFAKKTGNKTFGGKKLSKTKGKGGKGASLKAKKKEKAPARAAVGSGRRGSIPFVCSECYEEFLLPTNYSQEAVTCPECLHVGKKPDENFLRTVTIHKHGERKSLSSVLIAGILLLVGALALIWARSPYAELDAGTLQTVTYGLLGGCLLLGIIFFWLIIRFEGNRWEVYF